MYHVYIPVYCLYMYMYYVCRLYVWLAQLFLWHVWNVLWVHWAYLRVVVSPYLPTISMHALSVVYLYKRVHCRVSNYMAYGVYSPCVYDLHAGTWYHPSLVWFTWFSLSLSLSTDGRSKSKITVDGKCKLLLIREETGGPSKQLCQWADVLLLVFSYADDDSLAQVQSLWNFPTCTHVHLAVAIRHVHCMSIFWGALHFKWAIEL